MAHPFLSLALLLAAICGGLAAEPEDLPLTVIQEQQNDAQQVLLVQVTNDGTATDVFQTECGTDTFYEYAATVLEVSRTVEPDATALGAETDGEVMVPCRRLKFKTYEKEWPEEDCPGAVPDPGRLEEGACGMIYLTPAPSGSTYVLSVTGKRFFEAEADSGKCEEIMKQCEEMGDPGEPERCNDPNDPNCCGGVVCGGEGGDGGDGSNGARAVSVAGSVAAALLTAVAL